MTAQEARQKSDTALNSTKPNLARIFDSIDYTASRGFYWVTWYTLNQKELEILQELGYSVEQSPISGSYTISWNDGKRSKSNITSES